MHKKKGKQSVLAGELILTFLKTDKPKTVDANKPFDVEAAIVRILDEISSGTVYGEYLLNQVVVEAWRSGALGSLNIDRTDFADMVARQGCPTTTKHISGDMCPFRCSAGCDLFISSLVEGSLLGKGEAWFLIIYLQQSIRRRSFPSLTWYQSADGTSAIHDLTSPTPLWLDSEPSVLYVRTGSV